MPMPIHEKAIELVRSAQAFIKSISLIIATDRNIRIVRFYLKFIYKIILLEVKLIEVYSLEFYTLPVVVVISK